MLVSVFIPSTMHEKSQFMLAKQRVKFCLLKKNTKMRKLKLKYIWHLSLGLEDI